MQGTHRISRRTIKRFLQLAAAAFALGLGTAPAQAGDGAWQPADEGRDDEARADDAAGESPVYQHRFPLARAAGMRDVKLADLRVIDAAGRKLVQLPLHGESMVGPLADGSYTVLLRAGGLTEVHRIRIGGGTLPYLHFTETI